MSTSTWRLNQSRATALFVIPTIAGPTFLAACTTGVLRASEGGVLGAGASVVVELLASCFEEFALSLLKAQAVKNVVEAMSKTPKR